MPDIDNISSILNAVNEIIIKPKKKKNTISKQNFVPKLNKDLKISPDVDKLILEAEEYKKKLSFNTLQVDLVKHHNHKKKSEEENARIIKNLNLEIQNLENKLNNFQQNKEKLVNKDKTTSKNKTIHNLKIKEVLKNDVVTSLKIQDSTIGILNEKIKIFKNTEEKLRLQIIDLELDKTILLKKSKKFDEFKEYSNIIINTKEKLKSIYKQVEKQKKLFINLKNHSLKIERNSFFFKENYEKLIVENNDVKKRLKIAKDQIVAFEKDKLDLLTSIHELNEIVSKTNISPLKSPQKENFFTKEKKTETIE